MDDTERFIEFVEAVYADDPAMLAACLEQVDSEPEASWEVRILSAKRKTNPAAVSAESNVKDVSFDSTSLRIGR